MRSSLVRAKRRTLTRETPKPESSVLCPETPAGLPAIRNHHHYPGGRQMMSWDWDHDDDEGYDGHDDDDE